MVQEFSSAKTQVSLKNITHSPPDAVSYADSKYPSLNAVRSFVRRIVRTFQQNKHNIRYTAIDFIDVFGSSSAPFFTIIAP